MNYIVLVKQVPNIKNIPNEAWDWEKGTLKRSLLENVCNDLDKQALAFALQMRAKNNGKIVALSMGPTFAEEVLRYALSVGADVGVLLTDRKLGGADTAATAYPIAQTIRKIEKEIFNGDKNYVIVTGMQSVDGDTAQVPPQIAEDMGITHIAYATSFNFNGNLNIQRITRTGTETVSPLGYPCLVTVTEWSLPPNATFNRTRWAHFQKILCWGAADIKAEDSHIGLAGSRTTVYRIFSPKEVSKRTCSFETDFTALAKKIKEEYAKKLNSTEAVSDAPVYKIPEGKTPSYKGDLWVYAEQEDGEINPATFELIGKATELARPLGEKVGAVLIGKNVKGMAKDLIAYGASKVYVVDNDLLKDFLPLPYSRTVCDLIEKYHPQMMLFSATPLGRELGPRVAYRSNSGLTADCTNLDLFDFKRGSIDLIGVLRQTRPALGGNIMASIVTQNSTVQMSTARPGVMKALTPDSKRIGEVIEYNPEIKPADLGSRIVSTERRQLVSEIREASVIVCGGAGCRSKEGFDKYVRPLADSLGKYLGQEAMVGASRPVVELGIIDRGHQIGQTGQTVKPKVYLGIGISGAVQHVTGMQNADIIIAINKDPNARIFKACDYGILGNIEEVVPELIKALNEGAK